MPGAADPHPLSSCNPARRWGNYLDHLNPWLTMKKLVQEDLEIAPNTWKKYVKNAPPGSRRKL